MADNMVRSIGQEKKVDKSSESGFREEKQKIIPKQASSPVKVYTSNIGRQRAPSMRWESPEWDLAECGRIIDTEALVRRAFAVKEGLFTKEGYEFIGQNPQRVAYVKKRLLQMEHAGAQAFSSIDTLLAPFIKADNLDYKRVKQNMQMLVFSLNVPSRWGCQAPFTNFTFDWVVPEDMKVRDFDLHGRPTIELNSESIALSAAYQIFEKILNH